MIVGSDSLVNIHLCLCDFQRAKSVLKVCFRIDSDLLKEDRRNPSAEQDKTKSRRDNEKVFLSYC